MPPGMLETRGLGGNLQENTSQNVVYSSYEVSELPWGPRGTELFEGPLPGSAPPSTAMSPISPCLAPRTGVSVLASCEIALYLIDIIMVHIVCLEPSVVRTTLYSITSPVSYRQEQSFFLSVLRQICPCHLPWTLVPSR